MEISFERLLRKWTWWFRLRRTLGWLVNGLICGSALGLGVCLAAMSVSVGYNGRGLVVEEYLLILIGSIAISAAVAVLGGLFWRVRPLQVARLIDHEFDLCQRAITSLEYSMKPIHQSSPCLVFNPDLVRRQMQDTLNSSRDLAPSARFFWRMTPLQLGLILLLGVSSVTAGVMGAPLFERTQKERAFQQVINNEVERIEELIQQIEQEEGVYAELTPEQRQELAQALEQGAKDLKQSQTSEQAVASLENTRDRLQELNSQQLQQQDQVAQQIQNLRQLGQELLQTSSDPIAPPLESFAQNLADGDLQAAAQELTNLAEGTPLSPDQLATLADQLEQAAAGLTENPALADQFQQAAGALRQGDLENAQQALKQASEMISQTAQGQPGQAVTQQNVFQQQIDAQVSEGQQHIIAQGQSAQGQAASGQSSQGQSGSGAGQGEASGDAGQAAQGQGPEASSNPINQDNAPGDGGESPYQQINPPQNLNSNPDMNAMGPLVTLPKSSAPGDQILGQTNASPPAASPGDAGSVPYIQVLPAYEEVVRRAVDNGQIPPALIPLVKKYFSQLGSSLSP